MHRNRRDYRVLKHVFDGKNSKIIDHESNYNSKWFISDEWRFKTNENAINK